MATLAAVAARRAATLARTPLPSQPASLIPRRGLAGAAGILHLPFFLKKKYLFVTNRVKFVSRFHFSFNLLSP